MTDPWAVFKPAGAPTEADPWASFTPYQPSPDELGLRPPGAAPAPQPYKGSILPFSVDAKGRAHFDSDAGIIGSIKSALTLPGDVATGRTPMSFPSNTADLSRVVDLMGVASPINPAIRAGDKIIPGVTKNLQPERPRIPTAEELRAAGSAGYDAVRDMGVQYSSDAVANVARALVGRLEGDGILSELAPKSHSVAARLAQPPADSIATSAGVEAARRSFRRAGKGLDDTEREASRQGIQALDDFVQAADPATVVAGDASAAANALSAARGNYAAGKRSQVLADILTEGDLKAKVANSGANGDNATRQRVASALLKDKTVGFSPSELALVEEAAKGSWGRNALRFAGNLMGGGGGMGANVSGGISALGGMSAFGPLGAALGVAVPLGGRGVKMVADALTRRAVGRADEAVRMRSPMYEDLLANAPLVGGPSGSKEAIARALLETGAGIAR